ncbi:MAG: exo-alpha-sialidase [Bacteroidales bacterium]|nr:exo-alpha-sialidase [Bacteroidales bacterium]
MSKTGYFILIVFIVILPGCKVRRQTDTDLYSIPDLYESYRKFVIKSEFIFSFEDSPTPQCHASTIEETDVGFIAAWFGGTHEGHEDTGIWVSRNTEGEWTKPVEIVNGILSNDLHYPCWNPVLFQPEDGPLMLFYKVGMGPREWWGMLTTSYDNGQSWTEPRELGRGRHGKLIGPVKNKPLQLEDGTIICPSSIEYIDENNELFWRVFFEISTDGGQTWQATDYINDGIEFDAIQPCILTDTANRLQVLCRSKQNCITRSFSDDKGSTWSRMTCTGLSNPDSGIDAVSLTDGTHVLVYNHTQSRSGFPEGRNMLNLAISQDGINWKPVMTLEKQEGEYSYPAVIQTSDGLLHITYTYQRRTIKHIVIDPENL